MKFTKNTQTAILIATMVLIVLFSGPVSAQKKDSETKSSSTVSANAKNIENKLAQFLKKSGGFTKVIDNMWTSPFEGKSIGKFDVEVFSSASIGSDLILVSVTIAEKKDIKLSQDLLYKLLKFSADRVQVTITSNGDLIVESDINGRLMDWQEFNEAVQQLASAADLLHDQIKKDLTSTPK